MQRNYITVDVQKTRSGISTSMVLAKPADRRKQRRQNYHDYQKVVVMHPSRINSFLRTLFWGSGTFWRHRFGDGYLAPRMFDPELFWLRTSSLSCNVAKLFWRQCRHR